MMTWAREFQLARPSFACAGRRQRTNFTEQVVIGVESDIAMRTAKRQQIVELNDLGLLAELDAPQQIGVKPE